MKPPHLPLRVMDQGPEFAQSGVKGRVRTLLEVCAHTVLLRSEAHDSGRDP